MEFSFLPDLLREQFSAIYRAEFKSEPNFNFMSAVVGTENGVIKTFICIYATPIVDSLWVSPELKGTGAWKKILSKLKGLPWNIKPYFFAISSGEKAVCKRYTKVLGTEKLDWEVYR